MGGCLSGGRKRREEEAMSGSCRRAQGRSLRVSMGHRLAAAASMRREDLKKSKSRSKGHGEAETLPPINANLCTHRQKMAFSLPHAGGHE